ncbi:MAG TPA: hypothetical protein DER60_04085, partial [Syntrophomonas sp.]|nr:hypothetical protein [Syntrophomonas sp.]
PANAPDDSNVTCTTDNRMATYNGQTVSYDADGNLSGGPLNGQMTQYTFNSRNQLTAVGTTTYSYDAEGHRIAVNISGTEYDDVI